MFQAGTFCMEEKPSQRFPQREFARGGGGRSCREESHPKGDSHVPLILPLPPGHPRILERVQFGKVRDALRRELCPAPALRIHRHDCVGSTEISPCLLAG